MAEYGDRPATESLVAATSLSTALWEHKFVDVTSAGKVTAPTAEGAASAGILEIGNDAGGVCHVTVFGVTKVRMGAAIGGGKKITSAESGYGAAVGSGDTALGLTFSNAASGYLARAIIYPPGGQTVA